MHAIPTTLESAAAFVLATLLGIALAIIITYSQIAREALYPNLGVLPADPEDRAGPDVYRLARDRIAIADRVFGLHRVFPGRHRDHRRLCQCRQGHAAAVSGPDRKRVADLHQCPLSGGAACIFFSGMKIAITLAIIGVIIGEFT